MGRRRHRRGRGPYVRSRVDRDRLERLEKDGRLRDAARIAGRFHLDPVAVLAERDPLKREVRVAAYAVCQHDEEAAHKGKNAGMTAADVAGLPDED